MNLWNAVKGFAREQMVWIRYAFPWTGYTMKFKRPVDSNIRVSAPYGAKGPFWSWHMDKDGQWKHGVLCLDCDAVFNPLLAYKCPTCGSINVKAQHKGIDYAASVGTPVYAMMNGRIDRASWENPDDPGQGFGLRVRQTFRFHNANWRAYYGHLSTLNCKVGDYVGAGSVIAHSGESGHATGAHLHVEIRDPFNQQHPLYFEEDEV